MSPSSVVLALDVFDEHYLALSALFTVGMQLTCFFIAFKLQIDKITDLAGSSNFVLLALFTYVANDTHYTRQTVVTALVCVWGLRLGGFLLYRVLSRGHDARFDEMRARFWAFLGFWVFQILWVWIVSLPVTVLNASDSDREIVWQDYVGWALWGVGFVTQVLADQTKLAFNADPNNAKRVLRHGVWAWSRHPNYFGEISMWTGIFLSSSAVYNTAGNNAWFWVAILSPLWTFFLLMFISGVPLAEQRYNLRFKDDPTWATYRKTTSPLVPMPPALYALLNRRPLNLVLCEFPLYEKVEEQEENDGNVSQDDSAV